VLACTLAEAMRSPLGMNIVIENKPGASTHIAAQDVARAAPAMQDVMAGQVPVMFLDLASGLTHYSGRRGARHRLRRQGARRTAARRAGGQRPAASGSTPS
jgi:Tripartite tricarboxylate transporter family receptor